MDPGTVDLGLNKMWTSAVLEFRRTPNAFLWNCLIVLTGKSCKILVIPRPRLVDVTFPVT